MKLTLSYPVSPIHINQPFGANLNPTYKQEGLLGHNGIDFQAYHGQPVYATHDGVAYYEFDSGQGEGVVLRTNTPFDYNDGQCYFKTIYWHLCDAVKEPQFTSPIYTNVGFKPDQTGISELGWAVKSGDLIGYADNTGNSTGDHLHFGLKPQAQGEGNGAWYNTDQNNGYNGAIDPQPYFITGSSQIDPVTAQVIDLTNRLATEEKGSSPKLVVFLRNYTAYLIKKLTS